MKTPDRNPRNSARDDALGSMKANVTMLGFGLFILVYLVAIDHEEWFHMRPMSGVAMALSNASEHRSPEVKDEM
jgi:hypothetical protein